jgi:hypothetical protein
VSARNVAATQQRIEEWADQQGWEVRQSAEFLSRVLRAFWAYHDAGAHKVAATLLHLACDEEFDLTLDCEVGGELSAALGYDDDEDNDDWEPTESREQRERFLAKLLEENPCQQGSLPTQS